MLEIQSLKGNGEQAYVKDFMGEKLEIDTKYWVVVNFRDPMHHILSQFLECKYNPWGKRVTKNTGFPGYGKYNNVMDGFNEWISYFATKPNYYGDRKFIFNCYEP